MLAPDVDPADGAAQQPDLDLVVVLRDEDFGLELLDQWQQSQAVLAIVMPPGSRLVRLRSIDDLQPVTLRRGSTSEARPAGPPTVRPFRTHVDAGPGGLTRCRASRPCAGSRRGRWVGFTPVSSEEIRSRLGHPVIDADGHLREFLPAAFPYLREALGAADFERWRQQGTALNQATKTGGGLAQRRLTRKPQSAFWATVIDPVDRATAASPALLYERLGELGMDYVVLYPTEAMGVAGVEDEDLRLGLCRGFNEFFAAVSLPYADRMTASGLIPMHTPAEAMAELDHCAELGLKVVCIPHAVARLIAEVASTPESPYLWPGQTHWLDTFGLDSEYDYDPVWEAFRRHGFAVTSHGGMTIPIGVYS